jgi:hypothetical protein
MLTLWAIASTKNWMLSLNAKKKKNLKHIDQMIQNEQFFFKYFKQLFWNKISTGLGLF